MAAGDRYGESRGVLEGGFHLLDVLARFEAGAGLSELARHTQLPKATTYRLLEQLVELGAVERREKLYLIGPLLGRLGSSWQPDPVLAAAARAPVRALSARTTTAVAVSVLHRGRVLVAAGTRGPLTEIPPPRPGDAVAERTATARLHQLLANPPAGEPPPGYTPAAWRAEHRRYERAGAMVVEQQEVVSGISCVAVPVRGPDGTAVAAVTALAIRNSLPPGLAELTAHAAREITRSLVRAPARGTEDRSGQRRRVG